MPATRPGFTASRSDVATIDELSEDAAGGALAEIYDEIRRYSGAAYVSSLYRYLATMPGCLEWSWSHLGPGFRSGAIPTAAWDQAARIAVPPLPALSPPALRLLGVDDRAAASIRHTCLTFARVSPVNLLFAGCLRRQLTGASSVRAIDNRAGWTPPDMLPAPPAMLSPGDLAPDHRAVLLQLSTDMGGRTFVPGLYRMLAHWPGYLAHVATLLTPLFADPGIVGACEAFAVRIAALAEDMPAAPSDRPSPAPDQAAAIAAALDTYGRTSPQMVVFGTMLRDALPADAG